MILNSILLHNFMSYADAKLDFSSIQVACLTGANGAGKSALLDAVTWALWECARASSDELMRVGEREMWVDLRFMHEGQLYRVRRVRYKTPSKRGSKNLSKGNLELQIYCGDCYSPEKVISNSYGQGSSATERESITKLGKHGQSAILCDVRQGNYAVEMPGYEPLVAQTAGIDQLNILGRDLARARDEGDGALKSNWKSLTASSMRETQRQICALLRMDYDTFINSVYIRQGKADEFTMRMPTERKQVLSEILGLSYFDSLQEQSKEHARELKLRVDVLESVLIQLPSCERQLHDVQLVLTQTKSEFEKVVALADEAQTEANALSNEFDRLKLLEQNIESCRTKCVELDEDICYYVKQREEADSRLTVLLDLINQSPDIEKAAEKFDMLKNQVELFDQQALKHQDLSAERLKLESELTNMRSRLEMELSYCNSKVIELETETTKLGKEIAGKDKVAALYQQYKQLAEQEMEYAKKQETYVKFVERINYLESKITECKIRLETEHVQKQSTLADLSDVLKNAEAIEITKTKLQDEISLLDKYETQFELIEQQGIAAKTELKTAESQVDDLKRRKEENFKKIKELETDSDSTICPLCTAPIVDRLAVIEHYRQLNSNMDVEITNLLALITQLEDECDALRRKYIELRQKLAERKELDKQIGEFNEKMSSLVRAHETYRKLEEECKQLEKKLEYQDYADLERKSLASVKAEADKLAFDPAVYANLQGQLRAQRYIESKFQQIQRDTTELAKFEEELSNKRMRAAVLANELNNEAYGMEVRKELENIKERMAKLIYDVGTHSNLKAELSKLLWSTEKVKELSRALEEKPALEESLSNVKQILQNKNEQLRRLKDNICAWENEVQLLPGIVVQMQSHQEKVTVVYARKEEITKRLAVTEADELRLIATIEQMTASQAELELMKSDMNDYLFLAEAFGKKGIQAIIIENAVPEIENEANRILSRLTDNKMHVALLTQFQNKRGNMVETLELIIGDDIGSRNYELYSGGEAFKINFAIRVALARLLARRSGAKLETLIIDEGFGSQDEPSRERLVQAIRSIQRDFALILVITHMVDIKEMFPVQIQVTKSKGVSRLEMLA